MGGNFAEFIKEINTDNKLFELIISSFEEYKDERTYDGEKVYLYKLAQLVTSDILHIKELIGNIKVDYSNLKGGADYKIPQTMRALGLIEYKDELERMVDNKIEIKENSVYEIEIRATQIFVINYIVNKLKNVVPMDINDYFFLCSKKVKNIVKPYHLCRTTSY